MTGTATAPRVRWAPVIEQAAEIVRSYDTGVTLRQLFYRLVSAQLIPNTDTSYKRLSSLTADGRREGTFPDLLDRGRMIHRPLNFVDPLDALDWTTGRYRVDRTRGQEVSLYLGVEKNGLVEQLRTWFGDRGLPVLALGGYASQTYVSEVVTDTRVDARPAVLLYAGDFDPSGEDIDRDWIARTDCWDPGDPGRPGPRAGRRPRPADQPGQDHRLPRRRVRPAPREPHAGRGWTRCPRKPCEPLFEDAVTPFWDVSTYRQALVDEAADRDDLARARSVVTGDRE